MPQPPFVPQVELRTATCILSHGFPTLLNEAVLGIVLFEHDHCTICSNRIQSAEVVITPRHDA